MWRIHVTLFFVFAIHLIKLGNTIITSITSSLVSTKSKAEFFLYFSKFDAITNNLCTQNNVRLHHFFFYFNLYFKECLQSGGFWHSCKLHRKFSLIYTFFESTSFLFIIDLHIKKQIKTLQLKKHVVISLNLGHL